MFELCRRCQRIAEEEFEALTDEVCGFQQRTGETISRVFGAFPPRSPLEVHIW